MRRVVFPAPAGPVKRIKRDFGMTDALYQFPYGLHGAQGAKKKARQRRVLACRSFDGRI